MMYLKFKTFTKAMKNIWHNDIYCTKFEPPCNITINNNIAVPVLINKEFNNQTARFSIDLISRLIAIYIPPKYGLYKPHPDTIVINILTYGTGKYPILGCILMDKNKNLWISFRGTLEKVDIIQDFLYNETNVIAPFSHDREILIHQGFSNIYTSVKNTIFNAISKYKPKNIIITGHSLGSGVATVASYDIAKQYPNTKVVVYAFASPRVGNIKFAEAVNLATYSFYRIVNIADIIPTLPLSVMPNKNDYSNPYIYYHCGKEISFDQNWKSLENNHMIYNYRHFINSQK